MWNPNSWLKYPSKQLPNYSNSNAIFLVEKKLHHLPALVNYKEIEDLKAQLVLAEQGNAFVLQLGECAESLKSCLKEEFTRNFCNFISNVANVLQQELGIPIVRIGRIAGQFAKPRSNLLENNSEVPVFRGEIINSFALNAKTREANAYRMLLAYCSAKKTLKQIKECSFSNKANNYEKTVLYTSHEALLLNYEASLTRCVEGKGYYNLSAHTVWLGARTSKLPSPHVEYLRGILNPIGIKIHGKMSSNKLIKLITMLNPNNKQGKLILVIRLNNEDMLKILPSYIKTIQDHNLHVTYMVDPMHGNTKQYGTYKVRYIDDLIVNIKNFVSVCKSNKALPGGLHLESTFLPVTECLGGINNTVTEENLNTNYLTTCDPRLNYDQTVEIVTKATKFIKE